MIKCDKLCSINSYYLRTVKYLYNLPPFKYILNKEHKLILKNIFLLVA